MEKAGTFTFDQLIYGLGPIIFESIKIPFGIFDKYHRVLWANDALASLHQMSSQEINGKICYHVCHKRTEPCEDCYIQAVIQTGKTQVVGKWYEFPGRKKVWGEVHYYPIRSNEGDIAAIIVLGFDLTDKQNKIEVLKNYSKYLSDKLNVQNNGIQMVQSNEGEIKITVKLSDREREILRLLAEGYTNLQIASILSISSNTVKTHVNSIFNKVGVNDRTQAAVWATRNNLI